MLYYTILVTVIINKNSMIFFVYPGPEGSEENQFTPPWGWCKYIDFQAIYDK
jgi:hypothetical protein